jgi:DNA-binding MarR family transcriptional regulator
MPTSKQLAAALREWGDVFMRRSMRETIRFWKESGLSMPQISVLMHLHHHGACGVSEVGAHLSVTNAAASQLVDKLVQLGLLARAEAEHDRRARRLTLTPKGETFLQKGIDARRRWLEELADALTPEQQKVVGAALPHLTEAARKLEPDES